MAIGDSVGGGPKAPFYVVVGLVVVGLIALAVYRSDLVAPKGADSSGGKGAMIPPGIDKPALEAPDSKAVTTAKEYSFVPAAKLPAVKGISNYKQLNDNTVRFALNVWAGWGPVILANEGFAPGKIWKTPDGKPFKVELVLIDNPVAMRDAYVAGDIHIGWATLDMLPLFMEELKKDSRVAPRVYQQVDFSNGGDGIVVRDSIKSIADLRGKTVVLAQNSPSHFFLLNALINGGVQPSEVNFKFTQDAFQAAAAFNTDKSIAGCVSWSPDIYNLEKVKGNRMLVTTTTANKLIADVWFTRADFAKDRPDIVEGLVRGIFDAMVQLKDDASKKKCSELMSKGYSIPASDCLAMFGDAHSTNYAENRDFFMNQNNPANFERTWETACYLYKRINAITGATPFDQVMDFSIIQKLGTEEKYASQKNEYDVTFAPKSVGSIKAESREILTKTVVIHFFPNSWDLMQTITVKDGDKDVQKLYDPNVTNVIEEVGKLAGQYGAARIVIEGNTDASMKGRVPLSAVKELSLNRANAVKEALIRKFTKLQPNQFSAQGNGWDTPADANDPDNNAKNRRVEIKVYPLEASE